MDRENDTWLLVLASVFTLEFLKGWLGLGLTVVLIVAGIYNIVNLRRKYKIEKARRREESVRHSNELIRHSNEQTKRSEEHAEHLLRMEKLRRELGD